MGPNWRELGALLVELRKKRSLSQPKVLGLLGKNPGNTKILRLYEQGRRRPSRDALITLVTKGLGETAVRLINRALREGEYAPLTLEEISRLNLSKPMKLIPEAQKVRWGPLGSQPPGITIDGEEKVFIRWEVLKVEIERELFSQLAGVIPAACSAELGELADRPNWLVHVVKPDGERIGRVWFGPDPFKKWMWDGLVRVGGISRGTAVVWQIFQRYSDGSYRLVEANAPPLNFNHASSTDSKPTS